MFRPSDAGLAGRALVVDADAAARRHVHRLLATAGFTVTEAVDGSTALGLFHTSGADLVLCEMRLAGRDGVDLCRTFAANANVGVVVVSQSAEEFDKVLALEVGADDYVTKPYQDRELILRIAAVMRRTRGAGGPATEPIGTRWYGRLRLDAPDRAARVNGHVVHLSPKEFVLLEALARGGGRIVPRRHLLDAVWGVRDDHDVRSLDVYIRRLRTKLQPDPHGAELIVTVRGIGHRLAV